jgi:subtilisin family serine protease
MPKSSWKRMRTIIHSASSEIEAERFVLVSARRRQKRLPTVVRNHLQSGEIRGLFLDKLGVTIMPSLSAQEIEALEEAGAIVLGNEPVSIDETTIANTTGALPAADHLAAIGIDVPRSASLTGAGVVIGILDTGIDGNHPEFSGKNIDFCAFKIDGNRSTVKMKDYGSHGTHVAALAAGRNVGVAPEAGLAVAAVLTTKNAEGQLTGYLAQILAGLNWLADVGQRPQPVDIINASFGGPNSESGYYSTVSNHRLAGMLTIAAIGNSGTFGQHCAPAKMDCAIGVGAVDNHGRVAHFSDWGLTYAEPVPAATFKPDIMAPGVDIESAVPKGRYARMSGTSMAAPLVSGAAALLLHRDEALRGNPDDICGAIYKLVDALPDQGPGYDPIRGGSGRLNLKSLS